MTSDPLVPRRVEQLLVAGRCLSATHEGAGSARVMATCMVMGQAAGTASALALEAGLSPRNVDVQRLREVLRSQGAVLEESDVRDRLEPWPDELVMRDTNEL